MRTHALTTWTAGAVAASVTVGAALLLVFLNDSPADTAVDATQVGGVSVTAPSSTDADGSPATDPLFGVAARTGTKPTATKAAPATEQPESAQTAPVAARAPGGYKPASPGGGAQGSDLEVKGSVAGLYPGATKYLPLTFENTNNFAVDIVDMTITATSTGDCASSNLEVPTTWIPRRVEANSEQTFTVPVSLGSSAGTECAGAVFGLAYNGKAVKA